MPLSRSCTIQGSFQNRIPTPARLAAASPAVPQPHMSRGASAQRATAPARPARALQRMETPLESLVSTRVWTLDFEEKHLAQSVKEAKDKAYQRMRTETIRSPRLSGGTVSRNTVLIGNDDTFFQLKEEVLSNGYQNSENLWLKTRFPLAYELGMTGEKWLLDVSACVNVDNSGNICHLADVDGEEVQLP